MSKFNVGDRVKVILTEFEGQAFGHTLKMDECLGKIFTVKAVLALRNKIHAYTFDGSNWTWDERCLRRVRKAKTAQPLEADKEQRLGVALPLLPVAPASPVLEVSAGVPVKDIPQAITNTELVKFSKLAKGLKNKTKKGAGICSFAIEYPEVKGNYYIEAPCHASIGGHYELEKKALLLNLSGHTVNMSKEEYVRYTKYCDYIMARSPYSSSFKYFGIDDAMNNGVFMDVDKPLTEIAISAIALRMGSEYPDKWGVFHSLVNEGFSENVAHLLSYCVSAGGSFTGFCNSHKTIAGDCGAQGVIGFFKKGYTLTRGETPYRQSGTRKYGPISKSISKYEHHKPDQVTTYFKNLLGLEEIRDGWSRGYSKVSTEALNKAAKNLELVFKTKDAI